MNTRLPTSLLSLVAAITFALFASSPSAPAQTRVRNELPFPDVPGYVTLKCDFHMHTVFSDGSVWPTVRVEEAWRDGLDAIAITDHIEYQRYAPDVNTNRGRSYELAKAAASSFGIILINGAEITRGEPPGHLNALFLKSVPPLLTKDYRDALKAAADQGAFIFWNHPGWKQPDRKSVWYAEQGEFLEKGWLKGIEVVNGPEYDPIAHQWCLDKKLAMVANSDVHGPIGWDYDPGAGEHRPLTLVFAERRTEEAIKEALFTRRTVLYNQHQLYGDAAFLEPLFQNSLEVKLAPVRLKGKSRTAVQVFNRAPIAFELESAGAVKAVTVAKSVKLLPGKTTLIELTPKATDLAGQQTLALPFRVTNLKTAPEKALETELKVPVEFVR